MNYVHNKHPLLRFEDDVLVTKPIVALRLRLCVERGTKGVAAATTVDDYQLRNLLREIVTADRYK